MTPLRRSFAVVIPIVSTAVMVAARQALVPVLGNQAPLLLFVVAVQVSAWYGGLWSGLLATGLSALAGLVIFLPSEASGIIDLPMQVRLAIFLVIGVIISFLEESMHRMRRRLVVEVERVRKSSAELEVEVQRRVAAEAQNAEIEARRRVLEAELARRNRTLGMGEMAAALAHELNQPLCSIVNNARACQQGVKTGRMSGGELGDAVTALAEQAQRAGTIIQRLRGFLSRTPARLETVQVETLLADIIHLCEPEAKWQKIAVSKEVEHDLPAIQVDAVQIQQVLVNLLQNAFDACRGVEGERRAVVLSAERRGDEIVISVRDGGSGLAEASRGRLFEPHYSTKPHGMGMGLAICQRIAASHGGKIWAAPNAPYGTTFSLSLPLASRMPRHAVAV